MYIDEPLYGLLKKCQKFEWNNEHTEAVRRLKENLTVASGLQKAIYKKDTRVYVTVDTSPTGIGWVVNQEEEDNTRFPIWFGAKVLSERQRKYTQVKRELCGIVSAIKIDHDYLIGTEIIIKTNFSFFLISIYLLTKSKVSIQQLILDVKSQYQP